MAKTKLDVLYVKRLFVDGMEIDPMAPGGIGLLGMVPLDGPHLPDSEAKTVKALRDDFNALLEALRNAGLVE